MKPYSLRERGFTLIELLVSISIIGILSSLVMANTGFGSRQKNLERAAQQLALDIRRAENLSLAPSDSPTCFYGLMTASGDANHYSIYKDISLSCPGAVGYSGTASLVDAIAINSGITITSPTNFDIAFVPPEPITYINGLKNNPAAPLVITLRSLDGNAKTVTVNRFGQVEIQ